MNLAVVRGRITPLWIYPNPNGFSLRPIFLLHTEPSCSVHKGPPAWAEKKAA
jgi:hypothetical protein